MILTFKDISSILFNIEHEFKNYTLTDVDISNAVSSNSTENTLNWINDRYDNLELIYNAKWALIICSKKSFEDLLKLGKPTFPMLIVKEPKHVFSIIANRILVQKRKNVIHNNAVLDSQAIISENVAIGAGSVVGNCTIGKNTIIYSNCVINDNVTIGENVIINSGCVIGGNPFIFTKNKAGHFERFPAFGGVTLEDEVELGANNTIDRGSSGNTVLKKGVKTDNLVHISHDVVINENTLIIANTTIAGHTLIGANSKISPSASILQRLIIGENVHVGSGSVVNKNIPDNSVYLGNPAIEISKFAKLEREKRKVFKK